MDERVATKVEITCLLNRTIQPIRLWWAGERLTINAWHTRRATVTSWAGEVSTVDGRRFDLQFMQARGTWYAVELSAGDAR